MKLSEWAHVAEIVGGVAIIASLIFVGLQVKENTRVVIMTSDRAIDQQNVALNISVVESSDFADILVRGESDRSSLNPAERARFDNYCFARLGAYENVVGNFSEGLITDEEYEVWANHFEERFDKPGYKQFWVDHRNGYFAMFRSWADERYKIGDE
jgi:hypothetical protein